jgi:DNA primase
MYQAHEHGAGHSTARTVPLPVDLPDLCGQAGYELKRQGHSWGGASCPSCKDSSKHSNKFSVYVGRDGRWRFKCQACGVYGDTADFIALAKNISVNDALRELRSDTPGAGIHNPLVRSAEPPPGARPTSEQDAVTRILAALKAHALDAGPRSYLRGRGISDQVIDMAIDRGQLRMLPSDPARARSLLLELVGEDDLRTAGFMKAGSTWPAIAFRPIVALEPGCKGAEFRRIAKDASGPKAIRYGSMQWPWYFKRVDNPATVMVVEGFIDALSVMQGVSEADAVMGIPGINGWKGRWFDALKGKSPDIMVLIGVDNDEAGKGGTAKLAQLLDDLNLRNLVIVPPTGKDWNEVLTNRAFF